MDELLGPVSHLSLWFALSITRVSHLAYLCLHQRLSVQFLRLAYLPLDHMTGTKWPGPLTSCSNSAFTSAVTASCSRPPG